MFKVKNSFLILLFSSVLLQADERIALFTSDVIVRKDSTMQVTETIDVVCEGKQIRRGIVREFPTTYKSNGIATVVNFDLQSVTCNGAPVASHIERTWNGSKIYLGDKHRVLSPGKYTYILVYETNRQLGFFEKHDELYWNVTGNGWRLPITRVRASITLPDKASVQKVIGWTGYQGNRGSDYVHTIKNNMISFESTRSLRQYEGFTIAVAFDKGVILGPSMVQKVEWFIQDNGSIILLVLLIFILFLLIVIGYFGALSKNKSGIIIPLFTPPKDLTPSQVGFMDAMQFEDKHLAADIVDLAVRGFIKIDKKSDNYQLELENKKTEIKDLQHASRYDVEVLEELFGDALKCTLSKSSNMQKVKKISQRNIEKKVGSHVTVLYSFWLATWAVCIAIVLVLGGLFSVDQFMFWIILLFGGIASGSKYLYKIYTPTGRKLQDEIEGFELYLTTAELDRMKLTGTPPTRTPELYEKYLPYAIALGVEQSWTQQFASILKDAEQPDWYIGSGFYRGNGLGSSFSSSFSQTISSAVSAPGSSSGFGSGGSDSGGGCSGGGGGGGGGGGW